MKSDHVLSLDLGSAVFKLALMERREGSSRLLKARQVELPKGANATARVQALKTLLEGVSLPDGTQVVSVLDDPNTCIREILTPPMPAGELEGAARFELQSFMTLPLGEMALDCQLLEEAGAEGKQKLLAAALPTQTIQTHLELLESAGLQPTQLIPQAVTLAAWATNHPSAQDKTVALLNLGASNSEFLVVREGHPVFFRKVPVGGIDLTRAMTGTLMSAQGQVSLSEAEAEAIKREVGIPEAGADPASDKGISSMQLLSMLQGTLDRLVREVERSNSFYEESEGSEEIAHLILVGGGAHLKGLAPWLLERLGVSVEVPELTENLTDFQAPLSLLPALGAAQMAGSGINLIPSEIREAFKIKIQQAALKGLIAAVVVLAVLSWSGIQIQRHSLTQQIAAFEVEKRAFGPQLVAAQAAVGARQRLSAEPDWESLFQGLTHAVPPEAYLTDFNVQGKGAMLRGRIRKGGRSSEAVLSNMIQRLREGVWTQVSLRSCRTLEQSSELAEFELECRL